MFPYYDPNVMPLNMDYARAYVIFQRYTQSFPVDVALDKGTLFPELYKPYVEKKV